MRTLIHIECDSVNQGLLKTINALKAEYGLFPQKGRAGGGEDLAERFQETRSGRVLSFPCPVVVTLNNPLDNQLRLPQRKANPYLFMYELCHNLGGVPRMTPPLKQLCPGMERFANANGRFDGAYGVAWHSSFAGVGKGQLLSVIRHLQENPASRRAVITHTMNKYATESIVDMLNTSPDIPCNTQLMFAINGGALDLTVINRSNDIVWGMWGVNVFVFTCLQQLVARLLGKPVGKYRVFSNNAHLYERHVRFLSAHYDNIWGAAVIGHEPTLTHLPAPQDLDDFEAGCERLGTALQMLKSGEREERDRVEWEIWGKHTTWESLLWDALYGGWHGGKGVAGFYKAAIHHYNKEKNNAKR